VLKHQQTKQFQSKLTHLYLGLNLQRFNSKKCRKMPTRQPSRDFFTFMAGLSKFMAAFRLSRKTDVNVFFG